MPQKITVTVPFASGQHDKTAQPWLEPGNAASVTNGIFVKRNTIHKRPGIKALSKTESTTDQQSGNVSVAKRLAAYRNELLLIDGQYLRSYNDKNDTWVTKDEVSPCVATREVIAQSSTRVVDGDVAEANGYRIFVWADTIDAGGALYASIQDTSNGLITLTGYVGGTSAPARRPKLLTIGTTIIVVYQRSSDNALVGRKIDTTVTPAWGAETVLVSGVGTKANVAFDAVTITGGTLFIVAYEDNNGILTLRSFTAGLVLNTFNTNADANTPYTSIALRADTGSGLVWLAFSYTGGQAVKMATHNPTTLAPITAAWVIQAAAGPLWGKQLGIEQVDSTHACLLYGHDTAFKWEVRGATGGATMAPKTGWHQTPLSRPFAVASLDSVYGIRIYAMTGNVTGSLALYGRQMTQFLVELDIRNSGVEQGAHPVATISPRFSNTSGPTPRSIGSLTNATNVGVPSATSFVTFGTVAQSLGGITAAVAVTYDFNHPGGHTCVEMGDSLYISGGVPSVYDGNIIAELGSLFTADSATGGAVAGGSLAASQTYSYVFVLEWRDYKGQRHQGQPSGPISISTTGTNKQVNLTIPFVNLSTITDFYRNPNIAVAYVVPYRTVYTGGAMSTVYHRIVQDPPVAPFSGTNYPPNNTFAFTDDGTSDASDTAAAAAEQLYTTGGVVESDCPPSFTTICAHRGRIFGVADDQRTVWYSTQYAPGRPVRFNDTFTLSIEEGGPITAIASLEHYLIVFKADAIYYWTGSGPNVLGEQDDFAGPVKLPVDVGCTHVRSVLETTQGLVFRTRTGLALLTRGMQLQSNFGDAVEETLGATSFPIVAATIHPTRPEYWFESAASAAPGETLGKALVYNFRFDAWSVMSRYDTDKARAGARMAGAVNVSGSYYTATPFGQVYKEYSHVSDGTPGQFKDGGTGTINWVTLSVETAWVKPSLVEGVTRVGGYGRIWKYNLQEDWADYHDMQVSVAYDYAKNYAESVTFAGGFHTDSNVRFEEFEVNLARPLCESVRLLINDAAPSSGPASTTGQGGAFSALTAEIGAYPGANRLGSARRK